MAWNVLLKTNQDDDERQADSVKRLKAEILAVQGLVFITPEYNRSIPGVLKNAIDHASRPYGQSAWAGKPAGVLGVSVGAIGTALAQQHLRNVLAYLDVPTLNQPETFIQAKTPATPLGTALGANWDSGLPPPVGYTDAVEEYKERLSALCNTAPFVELEGGHGRHIR